MILDAHIASSSRHPGSSVMANSTSKDSTVEVTEIVSEIDTAEPSSHKSLISPKSSTAVTAAELIDLSRASGLPHMDKAAGTKLYPLHAATSKRKRPTSSLSSSSPSPPRTPRSYSFSREGHSQFDHSRIPVHPHRRTQTSPSNGSPFTSRRGSQTGLIDQKVYQRKKREDLLALHRESCRLFREAELAPGRFSRRDTTDTSLPASPTWFSFSSTTRSRDGGGSSRTLSELGGSPVTSPLLSSQRQLPLQLHPFPAAEEDEEAGNQFLLDRHDAPPARLQIVHARPDDPEEENERDDDDNDAFTYIPPTTAIDWTSPSTRKREYEKIDRANRGVRKLWHRVAPKWILSAGDSRTPFFEEGSDGRGNYEGSVRRFRMDIPDDGSGSERSDDDDGGDGDDDDGRCEKEEGKQKASRGGRGGGRRRRPRWLCLGVETLRF